MSKITRLIYLVALLSFLAGCGGSDKKEPSGNLGIWDTSKFDDGSVMDE